MRSRCKPDTSLQRPSLAAHPDDGRLYLGYTRTDGRIWLAWSDNGVDYNDRRPWLQPPIGGPAIVSDNVTFWLGYTEQGSQAVQVVQSQNPTFFETYVSPTPPNTAWTHRHCCSIRPGVGCWRGRASTSPVGTSTRASSVSAHPDPRHLQ